MKLKTLFKDLPFLEIKGSKDIQIHGITSHSKTVAPGHLFIAKKGASYNGSQFIPEAITGGAAAVLTDIYDPFIPQVSQVIHPDVQQIEAPIACRFYDYPSKKLFTVGVTGTNGKTTSAYLIKHLLDSLHRPCGLIGSIEYIFGSQKYPSTHTTPDVCSNQRFLHEIVKSGGSCAVMEVSSHALVQDRVKGIEYDVALFTNLTQDHLDFHKNMKQYCEAKSKLLQHLKKQNSHPCRFPQPPIAVINADCPWSQQFCQNYKGAKLSYGIESDADLKAKNIRLKENSLEFALDFSHTSTYFQVPLTGRFNVYNCLGAIAVALSAGAQLSSLPKILSQFKQVRGRMEQVPNDLGIHIFVDYAHTPNALENVLKSLHEFKKRKIITVFGCGGDRDKGKRTQMARAAELYSDHLVITSDNPRSEDPQKICDEIVAGLQSNTPYFCEVDRKQAIQTAIKMAQKNDCVLIAGKGHENYQVFNRKTVPFDDRAIAEEFCIQKKCMVTKSVAL